MRRSSYHGVRRSPAERERENTNRSKDRNRGNRLLRSCPHDMLDEHAHDLAPTARRAMLLEQMQGRQRVINCEKK